MNRPGTSLRQTTARPAAAGRAAADSVKIPRFEEFLARSDWVGAAAILELEKQGSAETTTLWQAYCAFHLGDYRRALNVYDDLLRKPKADKSLHVHKALCLFAQGSYEESKAELHKAGDASALSNRLAYLLAQKRSDDAALMSAHAKLTDAAADQLALAAVHFLRGHFDDSVDIYKKLLLTNKKNLALNVYLALCYYRQEYYEISQDSVNSYLTAQPNSVFATNLRACNTYQLKSGKEAEEELRKLEKKFEGGNLCEEHDLLRHNLSVFRNGENALKVFPPLLEIFPEARLNLVIHHLKNGEVDAAFKAVADLEPTSPREYTLKAVALAFYGQLRAAPDVLARAQQLYQLIGTSANECDTVSGRQCISSYLILRKQFDDALVYLRTIKEFMNQDDDFQWNFGLSLAATGKFVEAEEALLSVSSEALKAEFVYISWLARCYIMNGKPDLAWNLYLDMDTSNETLVLLSLIANDCFKQGFYYFSLKAFDILERLDNEDHSEGKLSAAAGVFKDFLVHKEQADQEHLDEAVQILKAPGAKNPRLDQLLQLIENYIRE